ncbi:hypothetical protein EYF80_032338 [Liparis tanakae]|uniref:Uncharacterized protein n=1 Tax=Liparis tanakae TaxID=230148 RepID=A0A4Z2GW20_9TELE|nr:hypothetical protein EYF80_032338 [Liparis tanakae]
MAAQARRCGNPGRLGGKIQNKIRRLVVKERCINKKTGHTDGLECVCHLHLLGASREQDSCAALKPAIKAVLLPAPLSLSFTPSKGHRRVK